MARFEQARTRLRDAPRDDPALRAAAEWLLDNFYLVRRVLGQLQEELPAGFQKRLPRLLPGGDPRALRLAECLYDGRRELSLDDLERFLGAYQSATPLTIAELWALPALLRFVVLGRFSAVLEAVTGGEHAPGSTPDAGSAAGRAVRALRLLAEVDWKELFCRQSATERILLEDPTRGYEAMDFDTRDSYRRAVEEIAWSSSLDETEVGRQALARARAAVPDSRHDHVGHWLFGTGRRELERSVGARAPSFERRLLQRPHLTFFGLLVTLQLALIAPVIVYSAAHQASLWLTVLAVALAWFPASVPATTLTHWLLSRLLRPRLLPKLDLSGGIPERFRTLVAVPTLLGDADEVDRLIADLEVRFLANPDPELRFALLTDHVDTDVPPGAEHQVRLSRAEQGIRRLNRRYGKDGSGPFHLLHRESRYNEAEGKWMGWERKRGKLEELNRYLRGATDTTYAVHVGDPEGLSGISFVLTLDTDTELPPGAAARLVGSLAHPLNRPRVDQRGRVREGYTVIQPRVEISPRAARLSPFTKLFSGDTGIDIYTRAVSEVYQDLFGEGVYVGKGIYDIDEFQRSLEGRVPDNSLLSHDLFEGVHGRGALATDIVVYEDYPHNYPAYLHRLHRWVRGDWQLLPWLFPRVPKAGGGTLKNELGFVDRFKILDNLRRSLLAPALMVLLACGWLLLPGHPLFWTLAAVLAPGAAAVWTMLRTGGLPRQELGRWFLALCFAPQEALTAVDAIGRVFVRMFVTHRRMLEWTTADRAARALENRSHRSYLERLWAGPAISAVIVATLGVVSPAALPWAAPWLLLWLLSPEIAFRISRPREASERALDESERSTLRLVARRTWAFFERFVGPTDHWLPPDHFQEQPLGLAAHRTSPTNIGMCLLSELAAYDLGYLGPLELASYVSNTLDTVERLERHRGHILNWYDTRTLAPLEPRYVSSVDSGNLAGALLALAAGLERVEDDPVLRPARAAGFRDTAALLVEALDAWTAAGPHAGAEKTLALARSLCEELDRSKAPERARLDEFAARLDAAEHALLEALRGGAEVSHDSTLLADLRWWLERLDHQLEEARREARLLLPEGDFWEALPIVDVARRSGSATESGAEYSAGAPSPAAENATKLRNRLRALAARARALAEAMDFRFLYDRERRMLHVGYNVSADRLDPHHYDLLASEARLASYLAIATGQVPAEHWFALGRPVARASGGGRALLSWGGSMFEYLMPALLMESHEDTLLYQSCEAAVDRQIAYGNEQGAPWGVSESGYAFLDSQEAYQYRAFGVPGLGLRRGLEEDFVVAPYASLLCLPFRPRAVLENFEKLEEHGMLGRFGFYEALDFHPERRVRGRPARVRSYMSHHQGMGLVAIDNRLNGDVMVRRFHSEPRIRGWSLLLDERVPMEVRTELPVIETAETSDVGLKPHVPLSNWAPDRRTHQVWALGNGTLTSLVTADGRGGLRQGKLAVTRRESDTLRDVSGFLLYLRDEENGELFGATPEPLGAWPDDGQVSFDAGTAEFRRRHGELSIRVRIAVASDEDVEVREVEIDNQGDRPRRIRVVGCVEPALEPERDAARHPAFSRLFLRCRPVAELSGVIVTRSPREGAPAPVLLFRAVADADAKPALLEVDRGGFFGRRGSLRAPGALSGIPVEPSRSTIDPLCACSAELDLPPGARRAAAFVTAVARTSAEVIDLGRRFGTGHAVRWTFEDAQRAAARRVQELEVSPALLPLAQRLLSGLMAPDRSLRAPESVLLRGRPTQQKLWGRGISGDDPIALVRLHGADSGALVDEVLSVHRYLRELGVHFDLVLIDNAPGGYVDEGSELVHRLLSASGAVPLLHQRGGVHPVRADQVGAQELVDLEASARVFLDGSAGTLAEQLTRRTEDPVELPPFEPAGPPPSAEAEPELTLEVPELAFDNGFGGFDGDDYVIRPGVVPPAPWCNVLANERFGCLVSEAGLGTSFSLNASENRLTPWHNDPVFDPPSEVLYLRDEETARIWSATSEPAGPPTLVRHGQGFSSYAQVYAGLEQTMTVFVPPDDPAKIVRLRLRNRSSRPRRLTVTYYAEWVLGGRRGDTAAYIVPDVSVADSCLFAEGSWSADFAGRMAFLASDRPLHGWTADRREMLGRSGELARPAALRRWGLSGRIAPGLDPCGAIQVHLDVGAGGEAEACFFLGQCETREAALDLVRRLRAPGAAEQAQQACRAFWQKLTGTLRVKTPDEALDRACNGWLLYQSFASRFLARTAFYQPGGAFGFRDQLQDVLAFIPSHSTLVRRHLLESAAHQFAEGDVLHWWHPPGDAGVRTRCSDDALWLIYAVAEYVEATGDSSVLRERVPFLSGDALRPGEHTRYARYSTGADASLLEHCRRALTRGFTSGPHGLPLIGDGDWNDGMDRVGEHGRGESIWLGWFVHACTERLAAMLELAGEPDEARKCREKLPALRGALSEHGWDGAWYRRAYHDDGTPVGSAHSAPPHIDSIAQSWAAISGAGEPDRVLQALESVERTLVLEEDRLVLLLAPPFGPAGPNPGYIAAYPAGIRENGGQYTHAAAWLGWAYVALGIGASAHRIFSLLNPVERTRTRRGVERYRVEPYVIAADVYGRPPFVGRGGWTWYTGAAAWTHRLAVEGILGLRLKGGALEVSPCLPPDWPGFEATLCTGELTIEIVVHNRAPGRQAHTELDGVSRDGTRVELTGRGKRKLEIWLGATESISSDSSARDDADENGNDRQHQQDVNESAKREVQRESE